MPSKGNNPHRVLLCLLLLSSLLLAWCGTSFAWTKEKPFSQTEFEKFTNDLPPFVKWLREQKARGGINREKSSFFLSNKGWEPKRFFYIYSHVMAAVQDVSPVVEQLEEEKRAISEIKDLEPRVKKEIMDKIDKAISDQRKSRDSYALPEQEKKIIAPRKSSLLKLFKSLEK
jgi:hypothetical protein